MTDDPHAYLIALGGLILSVMTMGLGTYLIIKFDRPRKPKKTDG